MYYQESDNIVADAPELRDQVSTLDEHLYANRGGYLRVVDTSELLDLDETELRSLLDEYEKYGVVERKTFPICRHCDVPMEGLENPVRCDLCDKSFDRTKLKEEVVFVPRNTTFESGDLHGDVTRSGPVEGVIPLAGCNNESRDADVIFIHGLGGHPIETWHPTGKPDLFWPKWIADDLPNVGVWALSYEAAKTKWAGNSLALSDRVADILGRLSLAGIGEKKVVFVAHSLGGLIVKELLRRGVGDNVADWTEVAESVRGVMFLATPHAGADMANYLKAVSTIARPTSAISDLEAHHPRLRESSVWFRNNVEKLGIRVNVLYETRPISFGLLSAIVVNATSSDPGIGGVVPEPVECNHIDICKPDSKTSKVYLHTLRLVKRVLAKP